MNSMRNVRTSNPKINKAPNKVTIESGIIKGSTISRLYVNTKLHRCIDSALICESSMIEKILNVLLLGEVDAIRRGRDLETKKVTKRTKVRHQELVTKMLLHKVNELRVITSNDHIINIEKKRDHEGRCGQRERVVVAGLKTSVSDN
jgi:hypothetical protein